LTKQAVMELPGRRRCIICLRLLPAKHEECIADSNYVAVAEHRLSALPAVYEGMVFTAQIYNFYLIGAPTHHGVLS
jgi:hypothetical protein